MTEPAFFLLDRLCLDIFSHRQMAWFFMDRTGAVTRFGGQAASLTTQLPETGTPIQDSLVFMEGILPLKGETLEFSCIQMEPDICLDARLYRRDTGYVLVVWDATEKEQLLSRTQQQCNELSLLIERQKNQITRNRRIDGQASMSFAFLEELFLALNYAVLEMNDQGHFVLLGTPPLWVSQLPESSRLLSGMSCEEDVFSFLGNFIQEAKTRWHKNPTQSFKSGLWIEKDHTGQEFLFEATGISVQGKKLLIIANDVCDPQEKQSLIQKGRDLALHYHELKRSGAEMRNMQSELEQRVRERTRDLEKANQALASELKERKRIEKEREDVAKQLRQSRKMEAIGTLAGGIAHDFNNILSAIMGFTELSLMDVDQGDPIQNKLEKIRQASERAKDLVRQILTFSHQTDHEQRPLKLSLVVKEALTLLRASIPAHIDIEQQIRCDAHILADPTQLHQVIMNLCTNAWHAMKQEGGTLSVTLTREEILETQLADMPGLSPGDHVRLSVKDTGCGMAPEILDRIFDPYFTTKDKDSGTGLGLSVVHGIVTKSGGIVQARSEPDQGSEFIVVLPAFDARAQRRPKTPDDLPRGNGEHILFVDDEKFQTDMAEELLVRLGYRVTACSDSIQALEIFESDSFDLVISDIIMPRMSGQLLAKRILGLSPGTPIILCSGYSDGVDPEELVDQGIRHYLMKPVNMATLAGAIRETLTD